MNIKDKKRENILIVEQVFLILVSDTMAKDKKNKDSDMDKLRMILDSPSDPKLQKILEKHENLRALRKRISSESEEPTKDVTSKEFLKEYGYDHLEPKVVVHEKGEIKPTKIEVEEVQSPIYDSKTEFEEVEEKEEKYDDDFQNLFENEDLIEVEKVDTLNQEFLEVKPRDAEESIKDDDRKLFVQVNNKKAPVDDEVIPEWEPVTDKKTDIEEFNEIKDDGKIDDDKKEEQIISEFTEVKVEKEDMTVYACRR